jgi:DNA-binding Lrp family transcriptional regulator
MIELDTLDRRLIQILQNDANQNSIKTAKYLKVSPMTVRRRIRRLVKAKVFRIHAMTDHANFGVGINAVITMKIDLKNIDSVMLVLQERYDIVFMGHTTGKWDVFCWVWFESSDHLSAFIENCIDPLEGILDTQFSIFTSIQKSLRIPIRE